MTQLPGDSEPPYVRHGGRVVYANNRKTFPLRLHKTERAEVQESRHLLPPSELLGRDPWDRRATTEADFWRSVGLDWVRFLKANVKDGDKGTLPSKVIEHLTRQVFDLSRELADTRLALLAPRRRKAKAPARKKAATKKRAMRASSSKAKAPARKKAATKKRAMRASSPKAKAPGRRRVQPSAPARAMRRGKQ
jgi:hypothetical protein